ncbi:NAD-dependent epimerase/dehydratase family protein [Pseudomonas sp. TUM22785]|uniref:NAD-dependent epimerase/dehydratase family protein n=1 Tax=Pseudomonas sp. TUM22785 TaxID=3019098 RepID=UPI00230585CB|nr:NAD-dependent epimerase/dehydratase family protein [Pseudomonas sp. TUM22785]WCD82143.1 NAD-dependent epimerase/dehydratase family protein [Pseudomonas sp. TUM22785]
MRVLITGGSGMVGRNLLEHTASNRFSIIAPSSQELNLYDFDATKKFLLKCSPDILIHSAGIVGGIQANIREPFKFLVGNLDIGRNLICAARDVGIKRLINLGSSCMYPRNCSDPLSEEMVLKGELEPTNEGYALAKIVSARLCDYISRENSEYQYKTLIPCNIYGRHDKFDPSQSHLIPAIIHKIQVAISNKKDSVDVWGDGLARREFMYSEDLADAIYSAIDRFETLPSIMNVGLGYDHTINEYYKEVAAIVGFEGQFVNDLSKPVGMARKLVCVKRLNKWGWEAKHSLSEGIEKTYKFYLEKHNK